MILNFALLLMYYMWEAEVNQRSELLLVFNDLNDLCLLRLRMPPIKEHFLR